MKILKNSEVPPKNPGWLIDLQVRNAKKEDLPALEWEGEYTHFRRVYAEVYRRTKHGLAVMWLAEAQGPGIIGQAFVQLKLSRNSALADGKRRAYLHSFRVQPEFRQFGVGATIMQVAENYLKKRGFRELALNVARDNPGALRLYRRLGYQVIGEDPGVWSFLDDQGKLQQVEEPGYRMLKKLRG